MENLQAFRIRTFDGGRNTQVSSYDLQGSESPDDLNVDGEVPGSIRKRRGLRRYVNQQLGADAITGLYRYYKVNDDKWLLALCRSSLFAGEGSPPEAMTAIKTDYTPGSWMTFATMQDWCYFSNYLDLPWRWDGTNLRLVGLERPEQLPQGHVAVVDVNGRMSAGSYVYTYRLKYGRLGASNKVDAETFGAANYSLFMTVTVGGANTAVDCQRIDLVAAFSAETPTHIQIYRSFAIDAATFARMLLSDDAAVWNDVGYYFVDEVPYGTGFITYRDKKHDVELGGLYEGDSLPVPKARYLAEHRNRLWYANCYLDGEANPGPQFPNRLYWSDLYQPDRIRGTVDIVTEDGDEITGVVSYKNNLLIFKRNRIYILMGSSPSNFETRPLNGSRGSPSPRTITHVEDSVFFLAGRDLCLGYDGASFHNISRKIRPDLLAIEPPFLEFACAGARQGRYYLATREP